MAPLHLDLQDDRARTATVWRADGEATRELDYASRIAARLAALGYTVTVRSNLDPIPDSGLDLGETDLHVLTGGNTSVNDRATWMPDGLTRVRAMVRLASLGRTSLFGICLGSQMIAEAVAPGCVRGADRIEVGIVPVSFPEGTVHVGSFHYEHISPYAVRAAGAVITGSNQHTEAQAFTLGRHISAVQFHPELSPEDMSVLIEHQAVTIAAYGGNLDAARASVRDFGVLWTPDTFTILLPAAVRDFA